MALQQLPTLTEDYPLFDWSKHQASRDALVKGTPTKQFAVTAWNAIVDDLESALAAAGLSWDATYTTAAEARITSTPGKLTAAAFNSVRLNIDRPAPLGWQWAYNPWFRGYLGREEVRGVATHGKQRDEVYPEYIIELVRKLNVLIEIMRETAVLTDVEVLQLVGVLVQVEAQACPAQYIEESHISRINPSIEIDSVPGAPIEVAQRMDALVSAEAESAPAAEMSRRLKLPLLIQVSGKARQAAPMTPETHLFKTVVAAEMDSTQFTSVVATVQPGTVVRGVLDPLPSQLVSGSVAGRTQATAEVMLRGAIAAEVRHLMRGLVAATATQKEARPAQAATLAATSMDSDVNLLPSVSVDVSYKSTVKVVCKVDSAWYPPVWVDGGLWIRQSHSVTQNENGELVIM